MDEYHEHREDCPFKFAPLDVCDCVQKNMTDRIEALERQVKAADALAEDLVSYNRGGAGPLTGWLDVEEALAAYRATKEGGA